MTKRRNAKFVVFSAAICLILCCTLVLGDTYAWFTDNVTSEGNIIASGNLDVEMIWSDDGQNWKDASTGKIFDHKLWEPGYTAVKYIKIENAGNLAFKYTLKLVSNEEATNGVKLSEVIDVYMGTGEVATRADLSKLRCVGTLADLMADADGAAYGALAGGDSKAVTIALHMQESADNKYQNLSIGDGVAVQLYATQDTVEKDSFDDQYDADTNYTGLYAKVSQISTEDISVPGYDLTNFNATGESYEMDVAYRFEATDTVEEAQASPYRYWHADFVISFDKAVAKNSAGLGGQYDFFGMDWVGFTAPMDIAADEEIRLLKPFDFYMNYEELCRDVKKFDCGAFNLDDANEGTTMTVELRLYETTGDPSTSTGSKNEETGNYITIGTYSYTFEKAAPADLPQANVTELTDDITFNDFSTGDPYTLDVAYSFEATESAADAQNSPYANWIADFVVTVDNDVPANAIALAGQYDAMGSSWYGMVIDQPVEGDTPVRLLQLMNWPRTYYDLCNEVKKFQCGAVAVDDAAYGTTMTVELRLFEVDVNGVETGVSYLVSQEKYTFGS